MTPVTLKGVIHYGPEMTVLYDPNSPRCPMDVQPSTVVEIPLNRPGLQPFTKFLHEKGEVKATVEGLLYGPGPLGDDDLSLPTVVAYINRIADRRYGHRGNFRTKLVVQSVLHFSPAPVSDVAQFTLAKPEPESRDLPTVASLALPSYPERAREAGLAGDVHVVAQVENGKATDIRITEGDRLFHDATIKNVQSWVFQDSPKTEADIVFSYRLEKRPTGSDEGVRVELSLPGHVTVVAPAYGW